MDDESYNEEDLTEAAWYNQLFIS